MAAVSESRIADDKFEQAFAPMSPAVPSPPLSAAPLVGIVSAAVVLSVLVAAVSGMGGEDLQLRAMELATLAVAATAVVAALGLRREWAAAVEARRAWTFVGVAMAAVAAGVLVGLANPSTAYPSVPDVARLAVYPLAVLALLGLVPQTARRWTVLLDGLVVGVSAAGLLWFLVLAPDAGDSGRWVVALATMTVVGDVVIGAVLVALLRQRPDDVAERSLHLLAAAVALVTIADVACAAQVLDGHLASGSWSRPLWLAGCILVAVAADCQRRAVHRRVFDAYSAGDHPSLAVSRLPYFAAAAAVAVLVRIAVGSGWSTDGGLLLAAAGVVAVVLVRQWLTVRDVNETLAQYRDVLDTDRLTGLPNRRRFLDEAEQTIHVTQMCGLPVGLVVVDVDGLRDLNDELGEPGGDAILREVANRVRMALRGRDLVARYGGDEIVALLPGTDDAGTDLVANRLRRELAAPVVVDGRSVDVSVSIGTAGSGHSATTTAELLIAGDESLERAKRFGRPAPVASNGTRARPEGRRLRAVESERTE